MGLFYFLGHQGIISATNGHLKKSLPNKTKQNKKIALESFFKKKQEKLASINK